MEKKTLEDFPHIIKNLSLFWGYQEFYDYVDQLLIDNRGGREGFPATVVSDLMFLKDVHEHILPDKKPKDIWAIHHLK